MSLSLVEPKPGDLIEIFRFAYQHWAIYVGNGYVIHLAPPCEIADAGFSSLMSVVADKAIVRKEPLWAVAKGDKYRINNKLDGKLPRQSIHQIIREAESLVGKTMSYSVTSENCEHFVTKLRYGKARSDQVRDAAVAGAVGIVGFGALVAVATVVSRLLSDNKYEDE